MSRLTHFFCLRSDGARALTPTPPSVTSASRVRLFPQYVRRIFPPLRWPLHWEPLEINNRKNERGALRAKAVRLSALEAADGLRRGGYASKLTISEARTSRQFVVPLTRISVNFKKPCAAHAELPPGEVSLHLQFAFLLIFHLSPNLCGLQTALPLRAALWLSPAAACRLLKMATADGGGETVVLLGLGARLAATLNCLDRSGAAAETSPSSWGSLRLTWAEELDASYSEMFDTFCARFTSNPACCVRHNVPLLFMSVAKQQHCFDLNNRYAWVEVCVAFIPPFFSISMNEVGHQFDGLRSQSHKSMPKKFH